MKVLLINPPLKSDNPSEPIPFPLGLGYLAASLKQAGHQPVILDACLGDARRAKGEQLYSVGLSQPEILEFVRNSDPDIIGISVPFTSRLKAAVELGITLREALPDTHLIAGGMHATVDPEMLLDRGFDAVLLGEAEQSLIAYVQGLNDDRKSQALSEGIAYRRDREDRVLPQISHISDLDVVPFPARDLVPFEDYLRRSGGRWIRPGLRVASMITSRGCPYRCTFCSAFRVAGRNYRRRSAENVLEEIAELVNHYRINVVAFEDDNLTADRQRAIEIFEGIARRFPKLQWITPNGVSIRNLDRELLGIMKRSGCRSVNLAFESGDPEVLRHAMKKDLDPEEGRQVRLWCREVGIGVNGYFILGMPGETPASMRRTMDFALSLDLDGIGIFIATPFPGTELYDQCKEQGYLDPDYARGDALFQSDPEVLHRPLIETPQLKRTELMAFHAEFERQFMKNYYANRPVARLKQLAMPILRRIGWRR